MDEWIEKQKTNKKHTVENVKSSFIVFMFILMTSVVKGGKRSMVSVNMLDIGSFY